MESLDDFENASDLAPSVPKSTAYFCNVLNHVKLSILSVLPFEESSLPVKYLGVPLVSTRLVYRDCNELVEKVRNRVPDWKNKSLSFAGRLQLLQSVLGSMNVYWSTMFMLPSRVINEVEQIMRSFLWQKGFLLSASVSDLIHDNMWSWPTEWGNILPPIEDNSGSILPFPVSQVWEAIRPRDVIVTSYHVVWFNQCIPKHAFHVWLVVKKKLKTQDMLQPWDVNGPVSCAFCGIQPDLHCHLFFECGFAAQVWNGICNSVQLDSYSDDWNIVLASFTSISTLKRVDAIIAKLVLGVSLYFIWQERNFRLFQQKRRSAQ
uniref:uncharacterized protein LOC122591571 n=1 Tax=Erigeron canadensis TaxID=72917 RepID=UPI001CB9A7A9|nr:uncharacterized protein LOC122591571 [Erigeron canadensis]